MTDYFALLHQLRLPWIDDESLKSKFLELSATVHPDRVHGASEIEKRSSTQRSAELNAAYNCLRDPKTRLQHLLELEAGAKPKQVEQISPGTMELFLKIGQLCREVDGFLAERNRVTSPVMKVELFERAQEWTDKLQHVRRDLTNQERILTAELKQLNAAWERAPVSGLARASALPLAELERIWRDFSYLGRWTGQIQERIVQLSF